MRTRLAGWVLALAVAGAFIALGGWQLGRMQQKRAVLADVAQILERRDARRLALAGDPARQRAFDWVAGEGAFAARAPVLLDNQQRDGRVGVRVYRVFDPHDTAFSVLVEMGWLPVGGDRALPGVGAPAAGPARVAGLLAPLPASGLAMGPALVARDGVLLATRLDPVAIAAAHGTGRPLAPRVLKLDPALPGGYARDLDVLPNTLPPERHLGYAVQWFALALAVLATALVLTLRRTRVRP